jgi:hypothetical protein
MMATTIQVVVMTTLAKRRLRHSCGLCQLGGLAGGGCWQACRSSNAAEKRKTPAMHEPGSS